MYYRRGQHAQLPATVRPSTASARVQLHARVGSVPEDPPRRVIAPGGARGRPQSSPRGVGAPSGAPPRVRPSTAGASPWGEGAFLTQQPEDEEGVGQGGWGDGAAPGVEEAVREAEASAKARP